MVRHASAYTIINNELYKRSNSDVFLRCVEPEEDVASLTTSIPAIVATMWELVP